MTRLYALDIGSLFAWQFFANEGEENGALRGIEAWFAGFRDTMQPTHIVACLDAGHARRAAIDPEYKLDRKTKDKPVGYIEQLREVPALLERLGIPSMRESGEEADDCIASVVRKHARPGVEVVVCSSDKDLSALVSECCTLYDPRPNKDGVCKFWDIAGVTERMGVPPWRVADLLAMMGDTADSIAGIKGIGEKRAKCAIRQTKSMNELFRKAVARQLTDLNESTQKTIAEGRAQFDHAMKLVEMRTDIEVPELDAFELRDAVAA